MHSISTRRCSIITNYTSTVFSQNVSFLLPSIHLSSDSLSPITERILQIWKAQYSFHTFLLSLTNTYLQGLSPRELYMVIWGGGEDNDQEFKELLKRIQQVLQSSQNREQFEGFVGELENIVNVRIYLVYHYEIHDVYTVTCRLVLS